MTRLLALVVALAGCSQWPAVCTDTLSGVRCDCRRVVFRIVAADDGQPYPAGKILVECNGLPLPVTVHAAEVAAPPCVP